MFSKGPNLKDIELPETFDTELTKQVVKTEKQVFFAKGVIAFVAVVAGIWFTYLGVVTDSTLKFAYKEATFEMSNAYPGIVFLVFGIILMLFSRINIKITK